MVPRGTGTTAEGRNTEVVCRRLWDWRGLLSVAFYFHRERLDLAFESSQAAARGSLPRTKARRRRRIHRARRTSLHCGLPSLVPRRRFRSPSRAVRLAMSECRLDPVLLPDTDLSGLVFAWFTSDRGFLYVPQWQHQSKHKSPRTLAGYSFGYKLFSYFLPPRCSLVSEGISCLLCAGTSSVENADRYSVPRLRAVVDRHGGHLWRPTTK